MASRWYCRLRLSAMAIPSPIIPFISTSAAPKPPSSVSP